MLPANEIRAPEIKREPLARTAEFEIEGWRDQTHFKIGGNVPLGKYGALVETDRLETAALKRLLLDIANTLWV